MEEVEVREEVEEVEVREEVEEVEVGEEVNLWGRPSACGGLSGRQLANDPGAINTITGIPKRTQPPKGPPKETNSLATRT